MQLVRRLWPFVRPHGGLLLLALLVALAQALVAVPVPFIIRHLFDDYLHPAGPRPSWLSGNPQEALWILIGGLLLVAALGGLFAFFRRVLAEKVGQNVVFDLRSSLFHHLCSLSMPYLRRRSTGRVALRFVGDMSSVLRLIRNGLLGAVTDLATVLVVAGLVLVLDWRLGLATLSVLPAYAFAIIRLSPRLREASHDLRSSRARYSGRLQEAISGMGLLKSFGMEPAEEALARKRTDVMRRNHIRRAASSGRIDGWGTGLVGLSAALILGYGSILVVRGDMTRGELVAFYVLAALLFPPMRRLARLNEIYQEAHVSLERIFKFLDHSAGAVERPGSVAYKPTGGAIRFEGVRFGYRSGVEALQGVDLEIAAGERVAIVGSNGAGKSTLVAMLPRFLEPTAGSVFIDGQDVRELTLSSLRRAVAVVPEEPFLFNGSVEANLRLGNPDASDEDLAAAVEAVRLDRLLKRLPKGLRTRVGERGLRLSGGERQRVAIARVILMNPSIYIMDEAMSSTDAASDRAIRRGIDRIFRGRTAIIIAHRLATTQSADRIIVMKHGRIAEQGTHAELLRLDGVYASFCRKQFLDPAPAGIPGD